ncbi:MAG: FtsX-like permease family protein [Planctomycetota bacterium]
MKSWHALRALGRVEWRQLQRHRARSWLVLLLVAVPVAAMAGGSTLLAITQPTVEEYRAAAMGRAALRVDAAPGQNLSAARALLSPTARCEELAIHAADLTAPGRRQGARSLVLAPSALQEDGLGVGLLRLIAGRAPAQAGEIALSPLLLERLDRSLGQTVQLAGLPYEVTGLVVDPERRDLPLAWRSAAPADARERAATPGVTSLLVELDEQAAAAAAVQLRASGYRTTLRTDVETGDRFEALMIFVVGGFGCFEAALVIGAAFAVSLRRRQRELGLLGANGASPATLRLAMLAVAGLLALAGALLGLAVGLGAAALLQPFLDDWNQRLNGAFEVPWLALVGALLLGLLATLAATGWPAWSASRLTVRVALSGRRPVTSGGGRWLVAGLTLLITGTILVLWSTGLSAPSAGPSLLAGSVLSVLGLGACSPWLLGVFARLAAPLPLPWRLAVRDAGRFRARNAPVVTAVLAGLSVSILLAALLSSIESMLGERLPALRDDQVLIEGLGAEALAQRLGSESAALASAPLQALHSAGQPATVEAAPAGWVACGSEDLVRALGAEAGLADFRAGKLLALNLPASASPAVLRDASGRALLQLDVSAVSTAQAVRGPSWLLDSATAASLGLHCGPPPQRASVPWLLRVPEPVTAALLSRASVLAAECAETAVETQQLRAGPDRRDYRIVLLICLLTGLVVVGVATALTAVESAGDARLLHVIGAAPAVLRGHLAARAGYLALLGSALAIPAGLLPALGLLSLSNSASSLRFSMPWLEIGLTLLGLPVAAFVGTWLLAPRLSPHTLVQGASS